MNLLFFVFKPGGVYVESAAFAAYLRHPAPETGGLGVNKIYHYLPGTVYVAPAGLEIFQDRGEAFFKRGAHSEIGRNFFFAFPVYVAAAALALEMVEDGYCRLSLVRRYHSGEPFAEPVVSTAKGVGTIKAGKLTAVLRTTTTRELESLDLALGTLTPLADPGMKARLAALRDAP